MNYDTYKDRVYGCWLGKMIAGNIGGPLEDCREIMDFQSLHEIAPDEMMVNDDLDVQLIWLNVLLEKGWELTSDDLMEALSPIIHMGRMNMDMEKEITEGELNLL